VSGALRTPRLLLRPWRDEDIAAFLEMSAEAAQAAVGCGFEQLGLSEIVALTVPANQRSRRVMERLGMTRSPQDDFDHPRLPEGPLRRHVLYRLRNPKAGSQVSSR
jgi:RimJ/RimL family protein N-acetyltransferase